MNVALETSRGNLKNTWLTVSGYVKCVITVITPGNTTISSPKKVQEMSGFCLQLHTQITILSYTHDGCRASFSGKHYFPCEALPRDPQAEEDFIGLGISLMMSWRSRLLLTLTLRRFMGLHWNNFTEIVFQPDTLTLLENPQKSNNKTLRRLTAFPRFPHAD